MSAADPRPLDHERDSNMTATYVKALVLETAIIILLWVFGRLFS